MFHWVRDVYPTLPAEQKPIEFIQESGDIVLLPSWWAHGTVSVGDTLGFFKVMNNKLEEKNPTGALMFPVVGFQTVYKQHNMHAL